MKTVGILTFHSSHNYGSNLLAYASYKVVEKVTKNKYKIEIIDLRTTTRDRKYSLLKSDFNIKSLGYNIFALLHFSTFKKRYNKYEGFIKKLLPLSDTEYKTNDELSKSSNIYDYLISASDQTWNTKAIDFDWSYFLNFTNKSKKIALSNSIGPRNLKLDNDEKEKVKEALLEYDFISVRDKATYDMVKDISTKESRLLCDPTIMLEKEEWLKLINKEKKVAGKYIFFYTLGSNKKMIKFVKNISEKLNMKVVIATLNNQYEIFSGFDMELDTGPLDFLNLIYNAELVITSSFHGAVFSTILNKPFYIIRRVNDNRTNTLMEMFKLESRLVDYEKDVDFCIDYKNINFEESEKKIVEERDKALKYLEDAFK